MTNKLKETKFASKDLTTLETLIRMHFIIIINIKSQKSEYLEISRSLTMIEKR